MTNETHDQEPYVEVFTEEDSRRLLSLDLSSTHVRIDGVPLDQYIERRVEALLSERSAADHETSMEVAALLRRYQRGDASKQPSTQPEAPDQADYPSDRRSEKPPAPTRQEDGKWQILYVSQIDASPLLAEIIATSRSDLPGTAAYDHNPHTIMQPSEC